MEIPENIRAFVRDIFRGCNINVSNKISKQPATWETFLDQSLINYLSNYSAPIRIEKNWVVRFETHFIGGMSHYKGWEVADIGVLIIFREYGKTIKTKVALLQSKRLYANELDFAEDSIDTYTNSFVRPYPPDTIYNKIIEPRVLTFDESSTYKALKIRNNQWCAIESYTRETGIPIYYLLYNPCRIPHSIELPLLADISFSSYSVGARILPANILMSVFKAQENDTNPSYGEIKRNLAAPFNEKANEAGWRLEDFFADQLIACKEGYAANDNKDELLYNLFYRRSGPIAAAFSITFDLTSEN